MEMSEDTSDFTLPRLTIVYSKYVNSNSDRSNFQQGCRFLGVCLTKRIQSARDLVLSMDPKSFFTNGNASGNCKSGERHLFSTGIRYGDNSWHY